MNVRVARVAAAGLLAASVITSAVAAVGALPPAGAEPGQRCDSTVGESIDSYLSRHPSIKEELTKKGEQESPGSPNALLDYLNRHPNVRQALITLSQQCVP